MEAKMARDWAAKFRQIGIEENEAWSAYKEAMARKAKAFPGNGNPTEDVLAKADEAYQRFQNALAKGTELTNALRGNRP